ncbi:MAG: MerR family transcriptional regulator [Lachnospiraceae bacterium]
MKKEKYYSIGEVSKICKLPIKTLRYYDEIKLLVPCLRKETSNYRYYTENQLVTVFIIRQLRLMGLGLKDIKKTVEKNTAEELGKNIQIKLTEIENEISTLQKIYTESQIFVKRIEEGENLLQSQKEGKNQEYFAVENIPYSYLYGTRSVIKSYRNEDVNLDRWIAINEEARKDNLEVCGPVFVTYYTEIYRKFLSTDCDIEFSIQVKPVEERGAKIRKFGGFLAASAIHTGDYDEIFKTYIALKRWILEGGYTITGPATEKFIISPIDLNNKEEQVTKILIPIKKK